MNTYSPNRTVASFWLIYVFDVCLSAAIAIEPRFLHFVLISTDIPIDKVKILR
jgi:hypothetical protein